MQRRERRPLQPRLRAVGRLLACSAIALSVLLAGCAHESVIVRSECPEPSPEEARDISDWLIEDPPRPGQDWVARVVGHIYADDLREVRGEGPETENAWGWMMPPWWRSEDE